MSIGIGPIGLFSGIGAALLQSLTANASIVVSVPIIASFAFRALQLYEQHEVTRQKEGLIDLDIKVEPLKSELATGKFTILVSLLCIPVIRRCI